MRPIITPPPPVRAGIVDSQHFTRVWGGWFRNLHNVLKTSVTATVNPGTLTFQNGLLVSSTPSIGLSVTIVTAALTSGGTQGSMTFVNGILTDQVPAT